MTEADRAEGAKDEPKGRHTKARAGNRRTKRGKKAKATARVIVSAEQLPRRSLEQALRVARALRDVLAGGPATWNDIASAMKIGASPQNKYYLWAAQAYNLVEKQDDQFSLSELGRKILAPTTPNEDREATVQAVLTPVILSRFFTDYNGSPFPGEEHIGNILERRYGVPRERVDEAKTLIRENGIFAGILQQQPDSSMLVRLDPAVTGIPQPPPVTETPLADTAAVEPLPTPISTTAFDSLCFVITPIGDDESEERRHANMVLKSIIEPVIT